MKNSTSPRHVGSQVVTWRQAPTWKNRERLHMNVVLIVLDSVGIGAAPDAAEYGDTGANTLAHLSSAAGGIHLPTLQQLGLGNIPALIPSGALIRGVPAVEQPRADYGANAGSIAGQRHDHRPLGNCGA